METRREILKKAVFVTPVILTLPAFASIARGGSGGKNDDEGEHGQGQNNNND